MAIAHDADSGAQGVFVNSVTWAHTCTGADLRLIVTMAYSLVPGMLVTAVTYNGVPLTVVGSTLTAPGGIKSVTYELLSPATGAHNIVLTTDNAGDILDCNATSYNGTDTSTASTVIATDVASGTPTTTTGTTTINKAWTVLTGSGGQTAGAGSTKRGTSHAQNGCLYDSGAQITPAGSYSMTTSDVSNHAWKMLQFGPSLGATKTLTATQGQAASLTALMLTEGQVAALFSLFTAASSGCTCHSLTPVVGVRPMPYRLDLYGVNSLEDLLRRLPEIITNTDVMLQYLYEDLKRVNDALDGSIT